MLEFSKQVLKKKLILEKIENKLASSSAVIFYNFSFAGSDEIIALKKKLKELGCIWIVCKNTLFNKALEDYLHISTKLKGSNAFVFCQEDQYSPLKVLDKFIFRNSKSRIQGGIYENEFIEGSKLKEWSSIPSKDKLIVEFCTLLFFEVFRFTKFISEIEKKRFNSSMNAAVIDQTKVDLIIEMVESLNSISLKTLNDKIKEKNGIDSSLMMSSSSSLQTEDQDDENSEVSYSLVLTSVGSQRMQVYKALKEMMESGLSIIEVKKRTDNLPYVISDQIDEAKANEWKNQLETLGASLDLKKN